MPRRNPLVQGYRYRYDARTGLGGFPPLRGVDRESDPGAIDDNEFAFLENVRVNPDGIIQSRGGQVKLHDAVLPGAVEGIFEAGPVGNPVVEGGSSPPPHHAPPVPPGGVVVVTLNPSGSGFYNTGWDTNIPSLAPWQLLGQTVYQHSLALTGAAMTPLTCTFDDIPVVPGTTPITSLVVLLAPHVFSGTDAAGFWLTNANAYIRARLGGVNLDAGPFTPLTDQHTIEYEFPAKPGGGGWTVTAVNACEFGFMIDVPFTPDPPNSKPSMLKLWVVARYNG